MQTNNNLPPADSNPAYDSDAYGQALLDAQSDQIAILDPQGFIVSVNKAWREFGRHNGVPEAANAYLGCNYLAVCEQAAPLPDAEDAQSASAGIRSVLNGSQAAFRLDYLCQGLKQPYWFTLQCSPIGAPRPGALIRHTDFTHQVQAEALLRQFETLVKDSDDGIISKSLAGIVRSWNAAAERIFGFSSSEMIGHSIDKLIPVNRKHEEPAMMARLSRGERIQHFETIRHHKAGHLIDVSITLSPMRNARGKITGVSKIVRDVTERKRLENSRERLEAQLRESQKMEAIGTLAGGIAHDFNNALASIIGNAELAHQDSAQNAAALESLDEIIKTGKRSHQLVQQILAFSRRQPTQQALLDLTAVVTATAQLLAATLPASIRLSVHCGPHIPRVMANAAQIEQTLINLVNNAVQATPNNQGTITITLDHLLPDALPRHTHPALNALIENRVGHLARLAVRDTGVGMTAEIQSRVFEPFFTTKPLDEGTGLGLSVVHSIVRQHQGAITVEGAPGNGTTFTVYLPASEAIAPAPTTTATLPTHRGDTPTLRLLYVDDEQALTFLVQRQLRRLGHTVSTYNDPHEAVAALRADQNAFDLLITDFNMPGLSGLGVARLARDIHPELPIAITSGYIDEHLESQALALGVKDVFLKATSTQEFCDAIQRIMDAMPQRKSRQRP